MGTKLPCIRLVQQFIILVFQTFVEVLYIYLKITYEHFNKIIWSNYISRPSTALTFYS